MAQQTFNSTKINVEFEESSSRQQLNSGENISTLFGKIKKIFADLKSVCFSGSYKDLSDTPTTATKDTDGLMSAEDKTKLDSADDTYALKSKYGDTTINVGRMTGTDVGQYSTAEGYETTASGKYSHAEGVGTTASGICSHAEGSSTTTNGMASHAEGNGTTAYGESSHSEGSSSYKVTDVITDFSSETTNDDIIAAWADKKFSLAKGDYSHSEGYNTLALSNSSHAEGLRTTASGYYSHAEGVGTKSSGGSSHAEGVLTTASGNYSHAGGSYTKALHDNEVAYGKYNVSNDNTLFSIGDGTSDSARHNAFEITTTGGKLHDKDIATMDDIPASLPADGGNADTVGGKSADDFAQIIDFGYNQTDTKIATGKSGKTTIYRCNNWTDCPSEFIDGQGTLITINYNGSGTVETGFIWCTQIIVNPRSGNKMFIRYIDSTYVSDWKEISTTPIESVQVGGTTNEYGNFLLWDGENNKIPICVESNGYHAYTYMMNVIYSDNTTKKMYFISMDNSGTPVQNKSVTATVYYIEI